MKKENQIMSVEYALIDNRGNIIAFDLNLELLMDYIEKIKNRLNCGVFYIHEVLNYGHTNKFVKTDKYIVVL